MIDRKTDFRSNIYRGQLQGNIDKATKKVPKKRQKSAEEVPKILILHNSKKQFYHI